MHIASNGDAGVRPPLEAERGRDVGLRFEFVQGEVEDPTAVGVNRGREVHRAVDRRGERKPDFESFKALKDALWNRFGLQKAADFGRGTCTHNGGVDGRGTLMAQRGVVGDVDR